MFNTIEWVAPGRRKAEKFVIYKADDEGNVVIQSGKTIAEVNLKTGKGVLNAKGSGSKYFHHLSFGDEYTFPKSLVDKIKRSVPQSGDEIGGGVVWA